METTKNITVANGYAVIPCAASAAATLEVRGAAVRGMKRDRFATTHDQGSPAWSPPL
jgi:hypothetical protein